jgi:hypothetical protein
MDLTESIAPKTDQQNFDDYLTGPRTVSISGVSKGSAEQPVNIELTEYPGKPYKPNKSMRRVLVSAWGADSSAYIGRRLVLVGNPSVSYGGKAVGGIEIAAMSHIAKRMTLSLTETRGKKRSFSVDALPAAPAADPLAIPERVLVAAPEAIEAGKGAEYLEYLRTNNAPAHIIEFVQDLSEDASKENDQ